MAALGLAASTCTLSQIHFKTAGCARIMSRAIVDVDLRPDKMECNGATTNATEI
jgi:hypothetical protein